MSFGFTCFSLSQFEEKPNMVGFPWVYKGPRKNAPTCLRCALGFPLSHAHKGTPKKHKPPIASVKVKRARLSGFLISKSRTMNSTDPILALRVSQGCVAHFFKSNPCQPQVKRSQRNHYIMGEPDRIGEHLTICPNPWQSGCQSLGACCWYWWAGELLDKKPTPNIQ